eukprot:5932408-Prymnesium_polylepis.1
MLALVTGSGTYASHQTHQNRAEKRSDEHLLTRAAASERGIPDHKLNGSFCHKGIPAYTVNESFCCARSCKVCSEAPDCRLLPGGTASCCIGTIRDSQQLCSAPDDTGCALSSEACQNDRVVGREVHQQLCSRWHRGRFATKHMYSSRQPCTSDWAPMNHQLWPYVEMVQPLPLQPFDQRSISVCIPAIGADLRIAVPRLLDSVVEQTLQPKEVILFISHVNKSTCDDARSRFASRFAKLDLVVECDSLLRNQAWARNAAARLARGTTLSFIDADDLMVPHKLSRLAETFQQYSPLLVLHAGSACRATARAQVWSPREPMLGETIHATAVATAWRRQHIFDSAVHSQPTVRAEVMHSVHGTLFRESRKCYRMEDSYFIRDVLARYGKHNSTAVLIQEPLAWYLPRLEQSGPPDMEGCSP